MRDRRRGRGNVGPGARRVRPALSAHLEEDHAAGYAGPEDQLPAALFAFGPAAGLEGGLNRDVIDGKATVGHPVPAPSDRLNAPVPKGHPDMGAPGDLGRDQSWIRRAIGHPRGTGGTGM